jgi:hypothetical protein
MPNCQESIRITTARPKKTRQNLSQTTISKDLMTMVLLEAGEVAVVDGEAEAEVKEHLVLSNLLGCREEEVEVVVGDAVGDVVVAMHLAVVV